MYTARVNETCTADGNIEYWTCSECQTIFTEAACENAITAAETVLPKHAHTPVHTARVNETCTADGNIEYWTCSECHKHFTDAEATKEVAENSLVIPALGHNLVPHAAVAATYTTAGNSAYWSCSRCGKYFSDEAGTNEIAEYSWMIPALSHNMVFHEAVAATCVTSGNSVYWYCEECYKYFSDASGEHEIEANSWVIPATGHSMTAHAAVAATCTTAGNSAYWSCDKCSKYFSDAEGANEIEANSWVIAATGHNMTAHAAVAATCTTAGNSAYRSEERRVGKECRSRWSPYH